MLEKSFIIFLDSSAMEKQKGKSIVLSDLWSRSDEGNGSSSGEDCHYEEGLNNGANVGTSDNGKNGFCKATANTRFLVADCNPETDTVAIDPITTSCGSVDDNILGARDLIAIRFNGGVESTRGVGDPIASKHRSILKNATS